MRAKPVNQQRSRDKRDRILNALDRLLAQRPYGDIGVTELAREAGVSPATLYQRFNNSDAIASVLLELYYQKVEDWALRPRPAGQVRSNSLQHTFREMALDAYDSVTEMGHVMRPVYLYSRQHPDRVGPEWSRLEQKARDGFKALLMKLSDQVGVDDVEHAADVVCRLFNLMLLGVLLHADGAAKKSSSRRAAFADDLAALASRYLSPSK